MNCCNYCIICMHNFAQPWETPQWNRLDFFRHGSGAEQSWSPSSHLQACLETLNPGRRQNHLWQWPTLGKMLQWRWKWRADLFPRAARMFPNKSQEMNCEAVLKTSMTKYCWLLPNEKRPHIVKNVLENKSYINLRLNRNEVADPQKYLDIQLFENN